ILEYQRDELRFVGIAGVLPLTNQQRIEIVPKFLPIDHPEWREDFLWIAAQTRFGSLFREHLLPVAASRRANLLEIIVQAWLDQFERNQRILIRNYRHTVWEEYPIDGDVDEEDLILPGPHGFLQHGLRLSAANPNNSLLLRAALSLRMQVAAPESALR